MSKNILIIGASSGIGKALAEELASKDYHLWAASRNPDKNNAGIHTFEWDVLKEFPEVDLPDQLHHLIYCPGTINLKPIRGLKADDFRHDFEINVIGAVKAIQANLKRLKSAGQASILLFSTVAVGQGMPYHASVASAKGAIEGLTRSLAAELAPNIRVNAIAPSLTDTPLAGKLLSTPERITSSSQRHPLKRIGTAEEIAAMASFLIDEKASWISGQVLGIDGGLSTLKVG